VDEVVPLHLRPPSGAPISSPSISNGIGPNATYTFTITVVGPALSLNPSSGTPGLRGMLTALTILRMKWRPWTVTLAMTVTLTSVTSGCHRGCSLATQFGVTDSVPVVGAKLAVTTETALRPSTTETTSRPSTTNC
jgi:hypothetical protein